MYLLSSNIYNFFVTIKLAKKFYQEFCTRVKNKEVSMTRILPIATFKAQAPNESKDNSKKTFEYPVTYQQYKNNYTITNVVLSTITGGLGACVMKLMKLSNKSSYIGGAIVGVGCLIMGISRQLNGTTKADYLAKKHKFENPGTYKWD